MNKKFKIGIDYGGTKIEGILLDESGKQIERKRYSYDKNYNSGIETVKKLVEEFDKISEQTCTVGIGIPGFSSKETGLITNANSLWLNDKPFKNDLYSNFFLFSVESTLSVTYSISSLVRNSSFKDTCQVPDFCIANKSGLI